MGAAVRIYVAAKFEEGPKIQKVYEKLKARGHKITHDWTNEDADKFKNVAGYAENCAVKDYRGVADADAVLLFNHDRLYGGATEMGIALALGVPVFTVGREIRENIFFNLNSSWGMRHFKDEDSAIEAMEESYRGVPWNERS